MPNAGENETAPWWQVVLVGRRPRFTLVRILVLVLVFLLVPKFVLLPIRVFGISMLPAYPDKKIKLVNRLAYVSNRPVRGDVVAIRYVGERVLLLKRVVGLPGETIGFRRGKLVINGEPKDEPYVKLPCSWNEPATALGPGEYYVVGDNRSMAFEDHTQGRVWLSQIVGKAL